ncbi:hypothetical protein [Gorillibacterium sp. sgz5001074]|uniref:hypothetical protein n=1 Tax=Gorillibacterium sp. sgz5001074 TaxID=3446695 RepID=UPI003F6658D4
MKSKNGLAVMVGLIIFVLLIGLAILLQSAYLLYAATAVPILLVPFLPDWSSTQTLRPGRRTSKVRLYRTAQEEGEGFLVIEADPGAIQWNKRKLLFSLEGVPVHTGDPLPASSAALTVLLYDLSKHGRKKSRFAIELAHLKDRVSSLSYTTDEVTRLVIRMEDLSTLDPAFQAPRTTQVRKGLEA